MQSGEPGAAAGRETSQAQSGADIAGLASLAEPTRRALYLYVCAQGSAVSRDEAAAGVGVPRHSAKFHLDKLVGDGLLDAEFARRTGRQGPGAGRPAKLYRRAAREIAVTLPERRYELAGQLMARGIAEARNTGVPVTEALDGAAREQGREWARVALRQAGDGASDAALLAAARRVLDDEGYETQPAGADPGLAGLTLANCPFHAIAVQHTAVVCGMNLAIMEGLLAGLPRLRLTAVLEPAEGRCCVRLAGPDQGGR
jgi:predicted ArsR family transcriptional regulator